MCKLAFSEKLASLQGVKTMDKTKIIKKKKMKRETDEEGYTYPERKYIICWECGEKGILILEQERPRSSLFFLRCYHMENGKMRTCKLSLWDAIDGVLIKDDDGDPACYLFG
jgi:hypothetical protein